MVLRVGRNIGGFCGEGWAPAVDPDTEWCIPVVSLLKMPEDQEAARRGRGLSTGDAKP